jgi:hypothetical protein
MDSSTKTSVITPRKSLFDLKPDEIWYYRDLFVLLAIEIINPDK